MKIATFLVLLIVIVAASGNSFVVKVLKYFYPCKLQQPKLPRGLQQPPKGRSQQQKLLRGLQQPPESQSQPQERQRDNLSISHCTFCDNVIFCKIFYLTF